MRRWLRELLLRWFCILEGEAWLSTQSVRVGGQRWCVWTLRTQPCGRGQVIDSGGIGRFRTHRKATAEAMRRFTGVRASCSMRPLKDARRAGTAGG